jgi:trans-aconitate 2-methyltransferase
MSRDIWNPRQYRAYSSHRSRPFFELLARVGAEDPAYVVDLGCGPGERTADLAARWPGAVVEGIDSSERMIAEALRSAGDARRSAADAPRSVVEAPRSVGEARRSGAGRSAGGSLRFTVGDLAEWAPDRPVDVIFSNAAFQWVPEHRRLFAAWVEALAPGGWLAFGMPGNFDGPSHSLLRELCDSPRWADRLGAVNRHNVVGEPQEYLDLLAGLGCEVDAWETTYLQVLQGEDPVLEWMKGTALRPAFDVLTDDAERREFLTELAGLLRQAYPPRPYGTVFPFRRIFVVARPGDAAPGDAAQQGGRR